MKVYFHPDQRLHHPQSYFSRGKMRTPQEIPARVDPLLAAMQHLGLAITPPQDSGLAPIVAVHDADYLAFLQQAYHAWHEIGEDWGEEVLSNVFVQAPNPAQGVLGQAAKYLLDGSCPVGQHTWPAAYWSAQSAIAATQAVLAGQSAAYALCRPPGHHARSAGAGGFCYLNNAAIAAQMLGQRYRKVVVLDTDMHHGQGVQEIFYQRDDVFYVSIHADPTNFYPAVAGFANETGQAAGLGFNLNLPMPHGSSEAVFFQQLNHAIKAIQHFQAEALVLSLGFDIYQEDPQSKVTVSSEGFARLGQAVKALNLPSVIVQEGGYHLESLQANACQFFAPWLS